MRGARAFTLLFAFSTALLIGVGCQHDDSNGAGSNSADLLITKTDGSASYTAGGPVTYTIVVSNAGPLNVVGATVADFPTALPQVQDAGWSCVGAGGAACTAGPAAGDINDTVTVPMGGTLTYTLVVTTKPEARGNLVNTANVTPPTGTTDPGPGANSATDTDINAADVPNIAGQYSLAITGISDACGYVGNGTNPLPIVIAQSATQGTLTSGDWSPGYALCGVVSQGTVGTDRTFPAVGEKTYLNLFGPGCGLTESHQWNLTVGAGGQVTGTWSLGLRDNPSGCAGLGSCSSLLHVDGPSCVSCWSCSAPVSEPTPERVRNFLERMKR
jgi:uncharacterized repeat protein (TIGR01451 family)